MSNDIIARGLAQKAQSYSQSASYSKGSVGRKLQETVSLKDFGAVGDGVTDDTAAVQAFVNYLTANRKRGTVPEGIYLLTATILFPLTDSWSIIGAHWATTTFRMATSNVPIFNIGGAAGGSGAGHSIRIEDIAFDYTTAQTGNTSATPLRFSGMVYQSTLRRIKFLGGYYGHVVASGVGGPWGCVYDELEFGNLLRGGAMDWTGAINGVPNNKWGRIVVYAGNMASTIFKSVRGYNWVIDTIEIMSASTQWFEIQSGSQVTIGAIKLENCSYTGTHAFSGVGLIYAPACEIEISQLFIGGITSISTTNTLYLLRATAPGHVTVNSLQFGGSALPANFYWNGGGEFTVHHITQGTYVVPLTNIGGSSSADTTSYTRDALPRLPGAGAEMGNANYTVTTNGGPNIITALTALTAPRDVEIMPDINYLFNGRTIRVISRGAVNGANTIVIKAGGITKATISADNYAVELMWRRSVGATHTGWQIIYQGPS